MKIGALIQARLSSQRFPGKVLHSVQNRPLLDYLLERLSHCAVLDHVVVVTSDDPSDDELVAFCQTKKISCFRGSLTNVAQRFSQALSQFNFDAFARVNGDSPLLDPDLLQNAVQSLKTGSYDIVTNVLKRSFPRGQSVEVLKTKVYQDAFPSFKEKNELEHVTPYFYANENQFKIHNIEAPKDFSQTRLSVDTPDDMAQFEHLVQQMTQPQWTYGWQDLIQLIQTPNGRSK